MKSIFLFVLMTGVLTSRLFGQPLISLNQPVAASSFQTGNDPTNGNDGNLTTRWAAADATYPQWWRVDLGSTQAITQANLFWYNSASRAYQYQIQISGDDVNYSLLVNNTNNVSFGNTTNTFSTLARYVRIYVTGCSVSGGYAGFYECQIYGSLPPAPSPHTADANTLVLFHLDEAAAGSVSTNVGSIGGNAYTVNLSSVTTTPPVVTNVMGAAGYNGFGNAANLNTPGYLIGFDANNSGAYEADNGSTVSADRIAMSRLNMGNGGQTPWTIEAMIYPSVTNQNQEIVTTDSSGSSRGFQFRLNTAGQLELNLISISGADITSPIPTTDPVNGYGPNNWYHVAATYDGTNIVLYWTKLSSTVAVANPISTNAVAVGAAFGAVQGPLCIGGENRAANGEYFRGLIDEVRLSSIARAPADMLNPSSAPALGIPVFSPSNNPVYAGTTLAFSATAAGNGQLFYAWQTDGGSGGTLTNIPGANTNPYIFNTTGMAPGTYRFDLVATNFFGSATSLAVTLNLANASGPVLVTDTLINPSRTYAGSPVLMSASFAGSAPISYQWFCGNVPVAGATNNVYSIASVQSANAGSYFLLASNNPPGLGGQISASTPTSLTVAPLPAGPSLTNTVSGLLCELMTHPEQTVITAQNPGFGWNYQPFFRNDTESGYRLIVASSLALATAGTGDMWDSGWVLSSNSLNVPYAGASLLPGTSYYWRLEPVNSAGQFGAFSAIQQFNTARQLSNPLTLSGVIYQPPSAGSANCSPLRYVAAPPVLVTNTAPGDWFIDFGQDAFGYATVHLNGNFSGTNLQARFGEMANGSAVNLSPPAGSTVRYGTSTATLQNGNLIYSIRPPSDSATINPPSAYGNVMPFRYFELTNCPGPLTFTDVVQERLVTDFDTNAASFSSSSPALNQVWNLCRNSMEWLTFDGIYVDGDRERTPYEADSYIHQLSSYAVNNDFTLPRCSFEYLLTHPTWPTEWKFHMIFVAWTDYLQTGNTDLLYKYYSALQPDTFTWAATGNGLMKGFPNFPQSTNSDIVDWPAGDRDGFVISSGSYLNWTNSVNNAFYYRSLQLMANIAALTGHANDAATYTAAAAQVYRAYQAAFWNNGSQCYVDGVGTAHASAHANFFPLAFGLVPASNQVAVVNYLHSRIAANQGMPPSVYGAQYLLDALFQAGDADTALGLMTTNGPRSWMNMINLGSTLTDEAWSLADKSNEDWNHAWGAAAGNQIARHVLGLQPLTAGFGQVLIQPQLGRTLAYLQGTIPTIRGPVSISVSNAPGQFQLLVNLPGNVTAIVMLPAFGATNPVALVDGELVSGTLANNWLTVTNIGSGQHAIWLNTNSVVSTTLLYNNWAAGCFGINATNVALAGQTADPDGDGLNNFSEFIAGTSPLDATDVFQIAAVNYSLAGPSMTVNLVGKAGRHYTLQHTFTLIPAAWTDADTQTATADNQTIILHDSSLGGSTQAFLRALVTYP